LGPGIVSAGIEIEEELNLRSDLQLKGFGNLDHLLV
jgi:hypothetical protein